MTYYRTLSFEERRNFKYTITELQELEKNYNSFKSNIKLNLRAERILDFQDMVEHFTNSDEIKSEDLNIIEGMQEGRNSPIYNGGNFSPIMDNPTHHFNKWVATTLTEK